MRIARTILGGFPVRIAHIVCERRGGSYYYPDYKNNRMAVAFEWYVPHRGWRFGYKLGIEFWIGEADLEQLGAYVLYGENHPKKGHSPNFDLGQQREFQRKIIGTLNLATGWRTQVESKQFYTVHYLQLHARGLLRRPFEVPSLDALILPTVLMGKQNMRVSAVIQMVRARFTEEAKQVAGRRFSKFCALLTLAAGEHFEPYKSTLGRTALKQFVNCPVPKIEDVYPRGKYKTISSGGVDESVWIGLKLLSEHYSSLDPKLQRKLDDSIFAYYTAKELLNKFPTVATVALIASLKLFRRNSKCEGAITCANCGILNFHHDLNGEAQSISDSLCEEFALGALDQKRNDLQGVVKQVYRAHRSGYVHDAILRHGEFGTQLPDHLPDEKAAISERLTRQNQLMTMELLTRRVLLQHIKVNTPT